MSYEVLWDQLNHVRNFLYERADTLLKKPDLGLFG